ncbi:leucyl aminopeptidase [Roseomonas sp. OT10]|uniref:leucyl aminopeptidase n=1 Tax=Roseomonas cutis TaxID=2897332 RepID=UPI001E40AD80|nr:leucyl aminopeptidase [Roseomonas sp. OT10]UFN50049.1 leucyl aminopeptidase [Roseomonas sp. OT10]
MLDIAFAKPVLPESGGLALLLAEEDLGEGAWHEWDRALGGAVARGIAAAEFKARKGATVTLLAPGHGLSRIVLVGLGKRAELNAPGIEAAGGAAAAALAAEGIAALDARAVGGWAGGAGDAALGATLRMYRFDKYRTTEKAEDRPRLTALKVLCDDPGTAKEGWAARRAVAEGVFLARDLSSEPPNVLYPEEFADRLEKLEKLGVDVEVLGPKDMRKLGFGALLGVAQGSEREPRMVVMRWNGTGQKKGSRPLCFVGKGVTFDTGGISIKPAGGMEDMKWDMAGAGTVAGLMAALAGRKAKADVVGLVGLVENMPSGTAQRPGDVVTTASGQTVEVINTDAEGRLVLADVLWYAKKRFDPVFMVDLATLTGAIIVALGNEHAGLFSNDDALAQRIEASGKAVGELVWRMPLGEAYDKQIRSDIADMKNVGGRPGGSITAAQFIQRFVDGCPWAHLDVAGTVWSSKDQPTTPKGATAWGVRLLDRLVAEHHEGQPAPLPPVRPAAEPEAAVSGAASSPALLSEGEPAPVVTAMPEPASEPAPAVAGAAPSRAPVRRPRKR